MVAMFALVNIAVRQDRFRRDLHSLVTRLTTVRLDDFGFGTHGAGVIKWWELVVMLHRSPSDRFFDGRFTVG